MSNLPALGGTAIDKKRHLWMLGLTVPLLPVGSAFFAWQSGWSILWFAGPAIVYGIIPLADFLFGTDAGNPDDSALEALETDRFYRWCIYLFIPAHYLVLGWAASLVATSNLGWMGFAGLTWSMGIVSGIAINTAHELGHKKPGMEKWLARITLAPVAYGHFYIEHNKGHHRRVATPEDPASARMGEGFWRFLPRTVIYSVASAWEIEKTRLARCGHGPWHWRNENLQAWSMTVLLFGGLTLALGWVVLPFLLIQAAIGASMLEVVNYVEHYGLLRGIDGSGRRVRCAPEHSWNSNHIVTNVFLYHLQRHSDHHAHPTRRYQALRHFDDAPQLPTGYAGMIALAYVPPLWNWLMNPRVVRHYNGDIRRANLQPGAERRLLQRYPPPVAA